MPFAQRFLTLNPLLPPFAYDKWLLMTILSNFELFRLTPARGPQSPRAVGCSTFTVSTESLCFKVMLAAILQSLPPPVLFP